MTETGLCAIAHAVHEWVNLLVNQNIDEENQMNMVVTKCFSQDAYTQKLNAKARKKFKQHANRRQRRTTRQQLRRNWLLDEENDIDLHPNVRLTTSYDVW